MGGQAMRERYGHGWWVVFGIGCLLAFFIITASGRIDSVVSQVLGGFQSPADQADNAFLALMWRRDGIAMLAGDLDSFQARYGSDAASWSDGTRAEYAMTEERLGQAIANYNAACQEYMGRRAHAWATLGAALPPPCTTIVEGLR